MDNTEWPYIARCRCCSQGLLRLMRCHSCQEVSAVCDECELIWQDVALVNQHPDTPASSAFPACPHCNQKTDAWQRLDRVQAQRAGLQDYILGESI